MKLFVGIAGGTGSGKTTVSKKIKAAFAKDERVLIVELDAYYREFSHYPVEERAQLNFDHPDSIDFDLLVKHLNDLKNGIPVEKPIYDFVTHSRMKETESLGVADIIIVEGILAFHLPEIRDMLDIKIFIDTDADIRILRRIRRDIEKRGRTFDDVRKQYYNTVRPMHRAFVEPTKQWADIIVPEGGNNHVAIDMIVATMKKWLDEHTIS